jgi:hypothetical protein
VEVESRYRLFAEGAMRLHDPAEPTRLRARTELDLRVRDGFRWRGRVGIRAFRDLALERSRYPEAAEEQQGDEVELRELTFGVAIGSLDLVAGRRQVAWGALFGQYVADRVVPFDLRDFLLPDADFIRRPQWMASLLATGERWSAEALVMVERRAHRLPAPGSEFALEPGDGVLAEAGESPGSDHDPSRLALGDLEPGFRVSTRSGGVDVAAYLLMTHPHIDPLATSGELGERDPVVGLTWAVAGGLYALRGEGALEFDRPLGLLDEDSERTDGEGLEVEDVGRIGVVLDRALPRAQIVSLQCVHESRSLLPPGGDGSGRTELALRWSSDPNANRLIASLELHYGFDGDWLARPRASTTIGTAWLIELGVDWFGGPDKTLYGQYDSQDRIVLTVSRAGQWPR